MLGWTNAFTNGVLTLETRSAIQDPWRPERNIFTSTSASNVSLLMTPDIFIRLAKSDTSATPQGFTNLAYSYGLIDTIAGAGGGRIDGISYWSSSFEGGPATAANLSRPHFAMADRAGNIYIAEKKVIRF